jgi:hypothetical protein
VLFFGYSTGNCCQDDTLSVAASTPYCTTSHGSVNIGCCKQGKENDPFIDRTITFSTGNVTLHVTSPQVDMAYTEHRGCVYCSHDQTSCIAGLEVFSYKLQGTGMPPRTPANQLHYQLVLVPLTRSSMVISDPRLPLGAVKLGPTTTR